MRMVLAFAAVGGFVGAGVAVVLRWIAHGAQHPQGWWTFSGEGRRYVDYLSVGVRQDTARLFLWSIGGGLVIGLLLGAAFAAFGLRLVRAADRQ